MELKQLIRECVHEAIQENMQRKAIREIVKNELKRMYNEGVFEADKKENNNNKKDDDEKGATNTARAQLNQMLKNPAIKKSQVAYHIMPDVDPNSARHILNDKLSGEDPLSTREANAAIDFIHNAGI